MCPTHVCQKWMGNAREIRSKHLPNRHLTLFCFKHHGNANQLLAVQRIPIIPLKNLIDCFPAKLVRINTISSELGKLFKTPSLRDGVSRFV